MQLLFCLLSQSSLGYREYTKEAEDFFRAPGESQNAAKASPSDDPSDMEDAESNGDDAPVLADRLRLRPRRSKALSAASSADAPLVASGRVRLRRRDSDEEEYLSSLSRPSSEDEGGRDSTDKESDGDSKRNGKQAKT